MPKKMQMENRRRRLLRGQGVMILKGGIFGAAHYFLFFFTLSKLLNGLN